MEIYKTDDSEELDEYDLESIPKDVEAIYYYYHTEPYEGYGEMILRWKGRWYRANLGHCSCYGPTEDISGQYLLNEQGYGTLEELREAITDELDKDLSSLYELLKHHSPERDASPLQDGE